MTGRHHKESYLNLGGVQGTEPCAFEAEGKGGHGWFA